MLRLFVIIAIISFSVDAVGQKLHGFVSDKLNGQRLQSVIVTASPTTDTSSARVYTIANENGGYELNLRAGLTYQISFALLGYETKNFNFDSSVRSAFNVTLTPKINQISEVLIRVPKTAYRQDTLEYNTAVFAAKQDRSMVEVLKRMPGINVADDGTIRYNGRPINRLYIEGMDMLKGKYGEAVNNLQPADVSYVQVLENHQPISALRNREFSNNAAINFKLAEKSKARLIYTAEAGVGLKPLSGFASLQTLHFGKHSQDLDFVKINNTGTDYSAEVNNHEIAFDAEIQPPVILNQLLSDIPASPPLSKSRYAINRTGLIAGNRLVKIGNNKFFSFRVSALAENLIHKVSDRTTFFLPQQVTQTVLDKHYGLEAKENSEFAGTFTNNDDKVYLNDDFSVKIDKSESKNSNEGTFSNKTINSFNNTIIQNNFDLIKSFGTHIFKVQSQTQVLNFPEALSITDLANGQASQNVTRKRLNQTLWSAFSQQVLGWSVEMLAGLKFKSQSLQSDLINYSAGSEHSAPKVSQDSLQNNIRYIQLAPFFSLAIFKDYKIWSVRLEAPFERQTLEIRTNLLPAEKAVSQWPQGLKLSGKVSLSALMTAKVALSLNSRFQEPETFMEKYLLTTFNTYSIGKESFNRQNQTTSVLSFEYRNPVNSLFGSIYADFSRNTKALLSEQVIVNNFSITKLTAFPNVEKRMQLTGQLSKAFDFAGMVASLGFSYRTDQEALSLQGTNTTTQNKSIIFKPHLFFKFLKHSNLEYEGDFKYTTSVVEASQGAKSLRSFTNKLEANCYATQWLSILPSVENFTSHDKFQKSFNTLFCDLKLRITPHSGFDFSLTGTNLLNKTEFSQQSYANSIYTEHTYRIRPRLIILEGLYRF